MSFQTTFEGQPILSWVIDDWEQFFDAIKIQNPSFDFQKFISKYKTRSYDNGIRLLFDDAPIKLNLGGETEKSKLIATDKPMGVFDFSLASRGMYKVPEYFSQKLADDFPDKFKEFELPSGVVPPDLITQRGLSNGENIYTYIDNGIEYNCIIRQKGETAIENGVKGATLKYATTNKKVYLTFKKNKGKVKYVELYSLFYYAALDGNEQYAVRHIPAMMVADYLESIGVKTRFYMTRFVQLNRQTLALREFTPQGVKLPLYEIAPSKENQDNLFIQPIIAKDFGEEFDKGLALSISQEYNQDIYSIMAEYALSKELLGAVQIGRGGKKSYVTPNIYGNPTWEQTQYLEGFERYRNKYQEYVKLGLYKSKEVLPQAMLFFHDLVIAKRFNEFIGRVGYYVKKIRDGNFSESQILIDININPFFVWWMRLSANGLKHKIDLLNSNELRKDLTNIERDLFRFKDELKEIVENIPQPNFDDFIYLSKPMSVYLQEFGEIILREYSITDSSNKITFKKYVTGITTEITTYAEGIFFETEKDRQETMDSLLDSIQEALLDF